MQIWFTRFNVPWKLFTHLWLSANTPSQLSRTIYFRSVCGWEYARQRKSLSLCRTLVRSMSLVSSTTTAITQITYKSIQQQQSQEHTDNSEVHLRVCLFFPLCPSLTRTHIHPLNLVEFSFLKLNSTQGNSGHIMYIYIAHCTHTMHSVQANKWVCVSVAQWQHDKWTRNLIFLHAVY